MHQIQLVCLAVKFCLFGPGLDLQNTFNELSPAVFKSCAVRLWLNDKLFYVHTYVDHSLYSTQFN